MKYNDELWRKYTNDNENVDQNRISKFIYYVSVSLGAKKICEAGCNVGNNLTEFPLDSEIFGFDMNESALEKTIKKYPSFQFSKENIRKTKFSNDMFDLVFTRGVLIHIPPDEIKNAIDELFRISKKWIFNLEYFGEDGKMIKWKRGDDLLWYRNMKKLWDKYPVEIISDVDIPIDIDFGKMRFTLIKKNNSS